MIRVAISLTYKRVPFNIEIEGSNEQAVMAYLDSQYLGKLIDRIKAFIDVMLEQKTNDPLELRG